MEAFIETRAYTSTRVVCALDTDDMTLDRYPDMPNDVGWYVAGDRNGFAPRLSAEAMANAETFDCLASFGDDHLPRTFAWDAELEHALTAMGGGVAYPNDGFQGHKCPTAPVLSSNVVRALGWYSPPCLQHMFVDDFWLYLGERLQRIRYLGDVFVEHMHPAAHKATPDETYDSTTGLMALDGAAWTMYVESGSFDADVQRVREALGW